MIIDISPTKLSEIRHNTILDGMDIIWNLVDQLSYEETYEYAAEMLLQYNVQMIIEDVNTALLNCWVDPLRYPLTISEQYWVEQHAQSLIDQAQSYIPDEYWN